MDAKLGMPEGDISYLLQKWSGSQFVKASYSESRSTLQEILGFASSVNCLEDIARRASEHAEVHFQQQGPVDPATEAEILVATGDCKGVPMRKVDAPPPREDSDVPRGKRLKKGEKRGQKRMACVGGVYSVAPFPRTAEEVVDETLRKQAQQRKRPAQPSGCPSRIAEHAGRGEAVTERRQAEILLTSASAVGTNGWKMVPTYSGRVCELIAMEMPGRVTSFASFVPEGRCLADGIAQ